MTREFDEHPDSFGEPRELSERERGEQEFRYASARRESMRAGYDRGRNVAKQSQMTDAEFAAIKSQYDAIQQPIDAAKREWERLLDQSSALSRRIKSETQAREIDRLVAEQLKGAT